MAKVFKILGIVLGALAVLVVLAALILPRVVNPNLYKTKVAELVRAKTGRTLTFGGDLSLSVFPWLGVRTGALSLSNAQGFGDAPFAAVQEADVRARLLPLLIGDIEVGAVVVRGLSLNLARNAQGKGNWEDLAGAKPSPSEAAAQMREENLGGAAPKPGAGALPALAVGGVRIEKAAITWDDRAAGQKVALKDLDLTTGEIAPGKPVDISFATALESSAPKLAGAIRLKTRAEYAPADKRSALTGLTLDVDLAGEGLPGGTLKASLAADLAMDYAKHRLDVANLKLAALGLALAGKAAVDGMPDVPAASADLTLAECNPRQVLAALGQAAPALKDDKALTRLAAALSLKATTTRVEVGSLKLSLDDTTLTGRAAAWDFARPAASFDLAADTLDLDRYLPAADKEPAKPDKADKKDEKKAEKKPTGKDGKPEEGLPKDKLRALFLDGALKVAALKVYGARLTDMTVTITAKDGVIKVSPLTASLYNGKLSTTLVADMSRDLTRSSLGLDLQDMLVGNLLKDVLGDDKVTGAAKLKLDLAATGEDAKALARSLDGLASFSLKSGAIKGFQVVPKSVREQAAAKDKRVETAEKEQVFSDISASFKIKDGVARSNDLGFTADNLKVSGAGLADLGKQAVDYKIKADMTGMPMIPFTVSGPFDNVSASLDAAEFAKDLAKSVLKAPEALGKGALDTGKSALEGIGQGIGSMFGGQKKDSGKK